MQDWELVLYPPQKEREDIQTLVETAASHGLVLTEQDTEYLLAENRALLRRSHRLAFGKNAAVMLAEKFSRSAYITKRDFLNVVTELTEFFYEMKNETQDSIGDDELIDELFDEFEHRCGGSVELTMSRMENRLLRGETDEPIGEETEDDE